MRSFVKVIFLHEHTVNIRLYFVEVLHNLYQYNVDIIYDNYIISVIYIDIPQKKMYSHFTVTCSCT